MKAFTTVATAAALALGIASASHAAVFAQFSPDTASADYKWVQSGAGTGGTFSNLPAGGTATHFSFLDPALSALAFIPATMTISATVADGNPATFNGGSGTWTQQKLDGSFHFTYTGATINNYLGSGINLIHNSNLLSGVFTDAWIQGGGGSGSTNLAIGNGGSATYSSDYELFLLKNPNSEEFAFNLLSVTPNFGGTSGVTSLNSFTANGGGNFSFGVAPEPAAWGLMIIGFAGVGAVVRNRRRPAITTA